MSPDPGAGGVRAEAGPAGGGPAETASGAGRRERPQGRGEEAAAATGEAAADGRLHRGRVEPG